MGNEVRIRVTAKDDASRVANSVVANFKLASSSIQRMGEIAGGILLAKGVSMVTDLGKSALTAGIGFNAMREQADIAFKTMLGGAEQAKAFLDELQRFAARTPFEFPDLLVASQRMVALGFAGRDIIPILTDIGDAAAALGASSETINRIVIALGQMQARGKTAAQEMLQLTEAGIPAWKFLAEEIGVSVPEAMKKVEQGAVSAQTTISAVRKGIQREFGGMMAEQAKTWNGMISTIKDNFRLLAGDVTKPIFDVLKGQLQNLQNAMDGGLAVSVLNVENGILKWSIGIIRAIDEAQKFGDKLQDIAKSLDPRDANLITRITGVDTSGYAKELTDILNPFSKSKNQGTVGSTPQIGAGGGMSPVEKWVQELIDANNAQIKTLQERASAETDLNAVLGEGSSAASGLAEGLKKATKSMMEMAAQAASDLFGRGTREELQKQLEIARIDELLSRMKGGTQGATALENQRERLQKDLTGMEAQNRMQQLRLQLADQTLLKEAEQNRMAEALIVKTGEVTGAYRTAADLMNVSVIPSIDAFIGRLYDIGKAVAEINAARDDNLGLATP